MITRYWCHWISRENQYHWFKRLSSNRLMRNLSSFSWPNPPPINLGLACGRETFSISRESWTSFALQQMVSFTEPGRGRVHESGAVPGADQPRVRDANPDGAGEVVVLRQDSGALPGRRGSRPEWPRPLWRYDILSNWGVLSCSTIKSDHTRQIWKSIFSVRARFAVGLRKFVDTIKPTRRGCLWHVRVLISFSNERSGMKNGLNTFEFFFVRKYRKRVVRFGKARQQESYMVSYMRSLPRISAVGPAWLSMMLKTFRCACVTRSPSEHEKALRPNLSRVFGRFHTPTVWYFFGRVFCVFSECIGTCRNHKCRCSQFILLSICYKK